MFKKIMSSVVCFILLQTVISIPNSAAGYAKKTDAERIEKVKAGVSALGTGTDAKVKLKLRDKRKLTGYISRVGNDSFSVVEKSGTETTIAYSEVMQVKGNNLSKGTKILIGVGIAAAAVGIIIAVLAGRNKGNDSPCVSSTQVGVPCPPGCVCTQ